MKKSARCKECGASLVEYALLIALIALVTAASAKLVGSEVKQTAMTVATELGAGAPGLNCRPGQPNFPACLEN
jgi:Flp pilus assembly pilin Flp